ncbi:MAG: tetratricopeptide repeat protein, partial [Bacteroidia bacterium]|nr:tetratricopeptide repeat protein [Bacteroidia bacterium]
MRLLSLLLFAFCIAIAYAQSFEQKNCTADTIKANELHIYAQQLEKEAKYDSAATYYEKASEIWKNACPNIKDLARKKWWENYIKARNKKGDLFISKNKPDSLGLTYLKETLEQAIQLLSENHYEVAISYTNLGNFCNQQGKYSQALDYYQKALAIRLALLPENHLEVAAAYSNLGTIFNKQGQYTKALECYQKALKIRLALLEPNHPTLANTYNNLGMVYYYQSHYKTALEYFQKALNIRLNSLGEKHSQTATSYYNIGNAYYFLGEYQQALEYMHKALNIQLPIFGERHIQVANTYYSIGIIYAEQGQYSPALEYYQKALQIRLATLPPKHHEIANNYNSLGNIYYHQGKYVQALEYYQKALEIRLANFSSTHPHVAASYYSIGLVYTKQGLYSQALYYHQKALEARLATYGENHPEVASSYNSIANIYSYQERYSQAIEYYQKTLAINLAIHGEKHPQIAFCYNNIAIIYKHQKKYNQALEYLQKALTIRQTLSGENHPDVASSYYVTGLAYGDQKQYIPALEYIQKALNIRLALHGENHPEVANIYNTLGDLYKEQSDYVRALEYYQKAIEIQIELLGKKHPKVANTYNNLATVYFAQKQYQEALEYTQKAIMSNTLPDQIEPEPLPSLKLKQILDPTYLINSLILQNQVLLHKSLSSGYNSQLLNSLTNTQNGSSLLNQWRQMMTQESDRIRLGEQSTRLYTTGIACAFLLDSLGIQQPSPLKHAFTFSEANKAATLLLAIQNNEALAAAGIPEHLNALQQNLKREISLCNQQLETLFKPQTHEDSLKKQSLQNQKFLLNQKLDSLIHAIEKEYPKYYELKYTNFIATVDTLQKTVLARSPRTALVEYFVSDTALFIFAITHKNFVAKKVLCTQKQLQKLLQQLGRSYYLIRESEEQDLHKMQNYIWAATQLYQLLLAPIEGVIKNKELVIVPDNVLWELPFELLIKPLEDGEGQNIEKLSWRKLAWVNTFHSIRYSPSATLFFRSVGLSSGKGRGLLAVAPVFDDKNFAPMLAIRSNQQVEVSYPQVVAALPGSEAEVLGIKTLFERRKEPAKILFRQEAREEVFTSMPLREYRYVHLATHGVFNRNKPSWSYLLFSAPQDSNPTLGRDGLLTAAECYNLELDAEVVVLSACETARGELKAGEGLMGLTRGLLYSGA